MKYLKKILPIVWGCFLAILEFNDISVDIHVKDAVLQRNLDLPLIENSDIVPGQFPVTTDANEDWSIF